jgi:hypothetical protein
LSYIRFLGAAVSIIQALTPESGKTRDKEISIATAKMFKK